MYNFISELYYRRNLIVYNYVCNYVYEFLLLIAINVALSSFTNVLIRQNINPAAQQYQPVRAILFAK